MIRICVSWVLLLLIPWFATAGESGMQPGLEASFSGSGSQSIDARILPEFALYVPSGRSPTPFLPEGAFQVKWRGFLSCELRGEYRFQAELNGSLKLDINGAAVLECNASGGVSQPGKAVRLNKGTNFLTATFNSPPAGDAFVRLSWIPKGGLSAPVPEAALSHEVNQANLSGFHELHIGRELFIEHRCVRCHTLEQIPAAPSAVENEAVLDAPSFEGIGSRRQRAWLARWILDPKAQRASARMPRVFRGEQAEQDASDVAAFLASLTEPDTKIELSSVSETRVNSGKRLFDDLHCIACHIAPDSKEVDPERLSLAHVREKFAPGKLPSFLKKPESHFACIRMPDFKLTDDEAGALSDYLLSVASAQGDVPKLLPKQAVVKVSEEASRERGRSLIQKVGCLGCHQFGIGNELVSPKLAEIPRIPSQQGCMAEQPSTNSAVPWFGFTPTERHAVQLFLQTDRAALTRSVPAEFAQREIRNLKCESCHGKIEGVPPIERIGGKLKPEWACQFIAGRIPYKPRPWLDARMPAFPSYAAGLGDGLTMLYGCPPKTAPEPPIDAAAAAVGQRLVSAEGGLSCISCHAIGRIPATQVFENAGVNLAYASERLLKPYFQRWVRNPLAIDPVSKMPVFFDEELRSPLPDFYQGDGAKQIEAIWQYLRLGDKIPAPPGTQAAQ
jgi:cytochrome c2